MIPLYTSEQFDVAKSYDILPLRCKQCNSTFYTKKCCIQLGIKGSVTNTYDCCSPKCAHLNRVTKLKIKCKQCGIEFYKRPSQIKKTKNHFCSSSCSCTYFNAHKTKDTRRSKLEKWIEERLTTLYPTLKIDYNKTDAINAELDIYIPSLKLAFELNGIFHYEPIYSKEKLEKTQTNDQWKFQVCSENKIELCIVDTSSQKYFKEKNSKQFLGIITEIINKKLCS